MPRKKYNIHYIYKTTCLITKRYYFGIHSTSNTDDGYLGSGKILRTSIRKYGKDNHIKEILEFFSNREDCEKNETLLINENIGDKFCINLTSGGKGFKMNHTEETKKKISNTLSNKTYVEIHGENNAEFEKEKRKKGALLQWENMDIVTKKTRSNKISNTLKEYFKKNPESKLLKKHKCPYCDTIGSGNSMFRWHFDNCKKNFDSCKKN
jgi:hypothetical protein